MRAVNQHHDTSHSLLLLMDVTVWIDPCLAAGANDGIIKPFDADELIEPVSKYVGK